MTPQKSIGSATMLADGTLVLDLRAEADDGTRGDARYVIPPDDARYRETLAHLGEMKPGDTRAVPPWPQRNA